MGSSLTQFLNVVQEKSLSLAICFIDKIIWWEAWECPGLWIRKFLSFQVRYTAIAKYRLPIVFSWISVWSGKQFPAWHWLQIGEKATGQALRTKSKKGQLEKRCSTVSSQLQNKQLVGDGFRELTILSLVNSLFLRASQSIKEHFGILKAFQTTETQGAMLPLNRKDCQIVFRETSLLWRSSQVTWS